MVATLPILLLLLLMPPVRTIWTGAYTAPGTMRLADCPVSGRSPPVWSPDGETICYVQHTHDENLFHFISPAESCCRPYPLPAPLTAAADLTWHPAGEVTFAASQGETQVQALAGHPERACASPRWFGSSARI